jgi:hypothetical protein
MNGGSSTARRSSRLHWLVGSLVLLASIFGLVAARPAQAADQVPFSATFTTTGLTVASCGPATACLSVTGSGEATHLGRTTFTRSIVSRNSLVPCPAVSSGTIRQFTDTLTLTAANGNTITLSGSGTSCANGIDVVSSGTYAVTGGTGRFSGASGTLTLQIARFAPDPETTTLTGTLSSPGSVKE